MKRALRRHRIPKGMEESVQRLVTGQTDPRMMRCCGTGCRPCAQDYLRAAREVLVGLAGEDAEPGRRLPSIGLRRGIKKGLSGLKGRLVD